MKAKFLFLLMMFTLNGFTQNDTKTTFFSITPRSSGNLKVNGLALGLGLNMSENNSIKSVNGMNIEVNPLSIFILMFDDPSRRGFQETPTLHVNGLNIGTGHSNMNEDIAYSGISISLFNAGYSCNGISINGIYNYSTKLNGLHLSLLSNDSKFANGMFVAFSNNSQQLNGIQIGVLNNSQSFKGIQIGIINKCKTQKGLQIGFWNSNNKRSMPFLNW